MVFLDLHDLPIIRLGKLNHPHKRVPPNQRSCVYDSRVQRVHAFGGVRVDHRWTGHGSVGPFLREGFFLGSVLAAIDDPGPNSSTALDLVVTSFGSRSIGRFDGRTNDIGL